MMTHQVCEYATLTYGKALDMSLDSTANSGDGKLDHAQISKTFFDWLASLDKPDKPGEKIFRWDKDKTLKLGSDVGYIEAPNGESLEVLPKTEQTGSQSVDSLRKLLQKMVSTTLSITPKEIRAADLRTNKEPLHEWIFGEFLKELSELVRRGLVFDYQVVEDEMTFVRGQLDMVRQMRQTPDKAMRFHVRYAEFSPQRIENRLLRTALDYVLKQTKNPENWRMANRLTHQLIDIEPIAVPLLQLSQWADTKLLLHYRKIKPWCQIILEKLNPNFQKGKHRGIALLFPMEKLFEAYLGKILNTSLKDDFELTSQAQNKYLLRHMPELGAEDRELFQMKPDFLVGNPKPRFVLDAKWKLLSSVYGKDKYKISQADLYQMFAYGHKYLGGKGCMMLIYPKHTGFSKPLPVFEYNEESTPALSLWCVPFDLELDALVGGDWQSKIDCFSVPPRVELPAVIAKSQAV